MILKISFLKLGKQCEEEGIKNVVFQYVIKTRILDNLCKITRSWALNIVSLLKLFSEKKKSNNLILQRKVTLGLDVFKGHIHLLTRKLRSFPPCDSSALSYCCCVNNHYLIFIYMFYTLLIYIYTVFKNVAVLRYCITVSQQNSL